jgi:hypothetical protein
VKQCERCRRTFDNSDKNGRDTLTVSATVTAPQPPTSQAAGCPNGKWTVNLKTLTATGATLTIEQPLGTRITHSQVLTWRDSGGGAAHGGSS